jgi:riboflavin-specific deaminase-like protein
MKSTDDVVSPVRPLERPPDARIRSRATASSEKGAPQAALMDAHSPTRSDTGPARADGWSDVPQAFRAAGRLPPHWDALFGPLRAGTVDGLMVVGQIGQSLDGRVATIDGRLEYINGPAGLAHLHRLRALMDAVVVGIGTALADDPQLTVRNVTGPNPARIVIDPRGRLPAQARLLGNDGIRRVLVVAEGARPAVPSDVEVLALPAENGHMAPSAILAALAHRGLRRVLIEGGCETLSRFLAAGCLDRLHVTVAPIILGSGRPSCALAPIACADQAIRPIVRTFPLGNEVLFDCDLAPQRRPVGCAKKST